MSTTPQTVTVNADLNKAVSDALNPEAIRAAVIAEAEKQGAAAADATTAQEAADRAKAAQEAADKAANAGTEFSRTEVIGGREFTFEASNELELERMVNNAYRVAYAVQEQQPETVETTDVNSPEAVAAAAQAAADKAAALAELELKFKRGEIPAAEYIEKSGALDTYLASKGIPLESLKAAVDQNQSTQFEQSWAEATDTFLNGPGSDWPGGEKNRELLGLKIASLGLVETDDKVAALAQAYQALKSTGMLFPGDAPAAATTTTSTATTVATPVATTVATPVAATVAAPVQKTAATSSSIFGASSGVGGNEGVSKIAPKGDVKIDPLANPQEIMEAWKREQVKAGKNLNDAFTETFSARRV